MARDHLQTRRAASGGETEEKPYTGIQVPVPVPVPVPVQIQIQTQIQEILTQVHICTPGTAQLRRDTSQKKRSRFDRSTPVPSNLQARPTRATGFLLSAIVPWLCCAVPFCQYKSGCLCDCKDGRFGCVLGRTTDYSAAAAMLKNCKRLLRSHLISSHPISSHLILSCHPPSLLTVRIIPIFGVWRGDR
jgi:hypothetical protein